MKFFRRLNRMVSANMHDLLDRCENPERALRHSVREMEDALRNALERAAKVVAQERLLERDREQHRALSKLANERAESFVKANQVEAAKNQLQIRRTHEAAIESLTQQIQDTARLSTTLRKRITDMQRKLELARTQVTVLGARQEATQAQRVLLSEVGALDESACALSRFDRLSRRILQAEAETEALVELTTGVRNAGDDSDDTAEIDAEIAAIKARVTAG